MQTSQDQVRVFRGLLWSPAWFFAHEGPYTKLAKIALVNLADSKRLNSTLFGVPDCAWDATLVHGRSLVDTRWMCQRPAPRSEHSLASVLQASSWVQAYGRGSVRLASDKQFRYCPACLDVGFQSSLMQMVGLDRCPVHLSALTNRCMHCNALCPRYAVCSEAFRQPMRCLSCRLPYSSAWSSSGLIESWKGIENQAGFSRTTRWIGHAGDLMAPELGSPELRELADGQQRLVVFDFVRRKLPFHLPIHRPAIVAIADGVVARPPPPSGRWELVAQRISIFKSLRRHFARALKTKKLWRAERRLNDLFQNFMGPLFSIEGMTHPDLHGFLLWRARFEGATDFPSDHRRRRSYRGQVLQYVFWPQDPKAVTSTMTGVAVDNNTWAFFVLFCLRNDLESARKWASAVAKARDMKGGEDSFTRRKREILSQMGWQLEPDSRDPPSGIGLVVSDDRATLYGVLPTF